MYEQPLLNHEPWLLNLAQSWFNQQQPRLNHEQSMLIYRCGSRTLPPGALILPP